MRITLRKKVLGLTFVCVLLVTAAITVISVMNILSRGEERTAAYRATLLTEKKQHIKGFVDMAVNVLEKMPPEDARKAARNMRYGQSGYLWVHDFNNIMIAHPDPRLDGKNQSDLRDPNGVYILREITKVCREKGEGYLDYMWRKPGEEEMKPKLSFARAIPARNWIVGTGIYVDDIDAAVAKQRSTIRQEVSSIIVQYVAISLVVLVILMIAAAFLVNRFIAGPIEAIIGTLKNFDNDLTVTVPVSSDDEVGDLARWLNEHIDKLHQLIGMVSEATEKVNAQAGSIADAVDQQAGFAVQLSSSVVEISATMEEFSSTASQIANHSQGVVDIADRTLQGTKGSATEVETLTMKMNDISQDNETNLREIVELGRKSKEITRIMEIINNIANQTKLIAFNAALEAASAGESGKRFGVVAVEIRRLADSVVESTSEIEGKITEIMDAVNRLVIASEKGSKGIREGMEYSGRTMEMLFDMVEGAESTTDAAKQISLSTQQQQTASSQVVIALRDIREGTQHSSSSIQQISNIAKDLAELADNLRLLVSRFHIAQQRPASEETGIS